MLKTALYSGALLGLGAAGGALLFYQPSSVAVSKEAPVDEAGGHDEGEPTPREGTPKTNLAAPGLAGTWVAKGDFCASGSPMILDANGGYKTEGGSGTWKFNDHVLEVAEHGEEKPYTGAVRVISAKEIVVDWHGQGAKRYRLCPSVGDEPWYPGQAISGEKKPEPALVLAALTQGDLAQASEIEGGDSFDCRINRNGQLIGLVSDSFAWIRAHGQFAGYGHEDGNVIGPRYYRMSVGSGLPGVGLSISPTDSWKDKGAFSVAPVEIRHYREQADSHDEEEGTGRALTGTLQCDNKAFS